MKNSGVLTLALSLAISTISFAQDIAKPGAITNLVAPFEVSNFAPNATITQGFEQVGTANPACTLAAPLVTQGWFARNNAAPVGTTCVFNGGAGTTFPAQAGAATEYAAMNFNNSTGTGAISTWFVTPRVQFGTGSRLEFWTRAAGTFADRMEIRTSTAADTGTPDVGTSLTDVGTFTNLVLTINPALVTADIACPTAPFTALASTIGGYPNTQWCRVVIEGAALPASGTGRIAFRYQVTNAGPDGANSNFVGLDTFSFVEGIAGTPITSAPVSGSNIRFSVPVGGTASATVAFSGGPGTVNCAVTPTGAGFTLSSATVAVPGTLTISTTGVGSGTLTCTGGTFTGTYGLSSALAVQAPALNVLGMLGLLAGIALVGVFAVRRYS